MEPYKTHRPTGFDYAGLGADRLGIGEFLILLGRNRDSPILSDSNFVTALRELGGESDSVQVHRFGHWACGWYELLLIDPADPVALQTAEEIEGALADYPVFSDEDYSEREMTAATEAWERESVRERVRIIQRYGRSERIPIFAARRDELPSGLYYGEWINAA